MENPTLADVLKDAVRDAQDLVRSEIALARAELREEVRRAGAGVAALAAAAVAAIVAVVLLLTTVAWAVSDALDWPVWAGFAVVTIVTMLAAAALALIGRRRLTVQRHMPLTTDTLKENLAWMRARTP